jgi:hypothetical protein
MKFQAKSLVLIFALITFGCAPLTSRTLLELSEREGQFYRELHPAVLEAQDTFRITADALITSTANRKAAIMRREAAAARQVVYESLAVPNPSKEKVEEAIGKLVGGNVAVHAMVDKQKEAAQMRVQAIDKTFEALDTSLGTIMENQQAIHGYLRARRRSFGRPGSSALFPFKTTAELRDYLRESVKNLEDQFKLAKELVDAARKEFSDQGEKNKP